MLWQEGREGYAMSEKACLHARRHKPEQEGIGTNENRQEGARTGEKGQAMGKKAQAMREGA